MQQPQELQNYSQMILVSFNAGSKLSKNPKRLLIPINSSSTTKCFGFFLNFHICNGSCCMCIWCSLVHACGCCDISTVCVIQRQPFKQQHKLCSYPWRMHNSCFFIPIHKKPKTSRFDKCFIEKILRVAIFFSRTKHFFLEIINFKC